MLEPINKKKRKWCELNARIASHDLIMSADSIHWYFRRKNQLFTESNMQCIARYHQCLDWGKWGLGFTKLPEAKPSRPRPTVQHQVSRFSTPQVVRSNSAECWGASRPPDRGAPRPGSWWAPQHCVWSSPMIFPMLWCVVWCRPVRASGSTGDRSHPPKRLVWWPSRHPRLGLGPRTRRSSRKRLEAVFPHTGEGRLRQEDAIFILLIKRCLPPSAVLPKLFDGRLQREVLRQLKWQKHPIRVNRQVLQAKCFEETLHRDDLLRPKGHGEVELCWRERGPHESHRDNTWRPTGRMKNWINGLSQQRLGYNQCQCGIIHWQDANHKARCNT